MEVVNAGSGDAFNSDGGHPFAADGPLYLCSRADPVPCTNDRSRPWRGPGSGGERARGGRTSTSRRARCPPTLLGAVPSAIFGGRTPTRPSVPVDLASWPRGDFWSFASTSEVHEGTMRSAAVGGACLPRRDVGVCAMCPPRPPRKKNCALGLQGLEEKYRGQPRVIGRRHPVHGRRCTGVDLVSGLLGEQCSPALAQPHRQTDRWCRFYCRGIHIFSFFL